MTFHHFQIPVDGWINSTEYHGNSYADTSQKPETEQKNYKSSGQLKGMTIV